MKAQTMAKLPGLFQRAGVYQLRVMVPLDLKAAYGGRARLNTSLGTADHRAATLKATKLRAEVLQEFADKRRGLAPQGLESVPRELAQDLAERVAANLLRNDDKMREDVAMAAVLDDLQKAAQAPYAPLTLGAPSPSPKARRTALDGLSPPQAATLAGLNDLREREAAVSLALRQRSAVVPMVMAEARKLGFTFDPTAPGAPEAFTLALQHYRVAARAAVDRDSGAAIETPTLTAKPSSIVKARKLRDVFDTWKTSGDAARSVDSIAVYDRALRQFEGQHPGLALTDLTRELGNGYRTWLRETCNTTKTARDRLNAIKSLLKFATESLEWLPKHTWRGLDIKTSTTNPRRPWSDDELKALFSSPLHTAYALPDAKYGGREAAYWIPLLGLYTGTRLGELCQLRTVDVKNVEGIDVLVLSEEGEGQKIKSDAGWRSVPIHSDLIRLGFLRYVATIRGKGEASLWPVLPLREGKPSDLFGRWFKDHRDALGIVGTRPDFHCFRHTVRPLMRKAGHSEGTMDKVTGHKTVGSIGTTVYDHRTLEEVKAAVESIQYPYLCLALQS